VVATGPGFGLSGRALTGSGALVAAFVDVITSVGLVAASVPDFVRATARSRRMTSLVDCYTCQLVIDCENASETHQLLIENIESLMKAIIGDWELLFEAGGTRECSFRVRLIGGSKESASLFELRVVSRVKEVSVLISTAYDEVYLALQRIQCLLRRVHDMDCACVCGKREAGEIVSCLSRRHVLMKMFDSTGWWKTMFGK